MIDEPPKRRGRDPAQQDRRTALVLAAYSRIAVQGFEGLRTRDVAAEVGLNVATLHYYFPTKEALIRAVLAHALARFTPTLPHAGSPAERLRGHLGALRHLVREDPDLFAVLNELTLRASRDPAIAAAMGHGSDAWHTSLQHLLEQCVRDGVLARNLDPGRVAALLVAAISGASLPGPSPHRLDRIDQTFDQLEQWLGLAAGEG